MAQFYAIQLQDANQTIQNLRDKNNQLREEITRLQLGDNSRSRELQEKVTDQKMEIQGLRGKCDLLQMHLDMLGTPSMAFHSQPQMRPVHGQHGGLAASGGSTFNSSHGMAGSDNQAQENIDPTMQL